jgi:L-lactate dehydrogenase complex protein LldG
MSSRNGDREAILGRVREALRIPAPLKHPAERSAGGEPTTAHFREWLPPVGPSLDEKFALFTKLSESLRSELTVCADLPQAAAAVANLASENSWKTIATHRGGLMDALTPLLPDALTQLCVDGGYDKNALEACDAGITECELLVAQTGSVCVTSDNSGGRVLSVLPPHHIVIARQSQLVTDLTEAYASLAAKYRAHYPSMISFITGPSRTGDIERILVLGAHGPKRLTILLLP